MNKYMKECIRKEDVTNHNKLVTEISKWESKLRLKEWEKRGKKVIISWTAWKRIF